MIRLNCLRLLQIIVEVILFDFGVALLLLELRLIYCRKCLRLELLWMLMG